MGVPEGWTTVSLSDVAEVRLGRQRSPSRAVGPNMRPYLRAANIGWGHLKLDDVKEMDFTPAEFATYALRPGDVLLNEASGSPAEVGKPAIYRGEVEGACFQNTLLRVRPTEGQATSEYLYHFLMRAALAGELGDSSTGTNIQHIGRTRLAAWSLALPPIEEQRKIAAILSSVDEAIEKTQAVIDQVQVVKKGLMQELLTRGIPGRHEKFKQTEIGEIPAEWEVVRLGAVAEVRLGRQRSPSRATGPNMRPYLRAANIGWGHLKLGDVKQMDFTAAEFETYALRTGDILLNEASGSPSEVGKPAIYRGEIEGACFQNTLLRVRANEERALIDFLFHFLMHAALEGKLGDSSSGTNIQHIGRARLAAWPVALPPIDEQRKAVAVLASADQSIEVTRMLLHQQSIVKSTLMSNLLTGTIRVTP